MDQTLKNNIEARLSRGPRVGRQVFLAPGCVVVGEVAIGDYSSIWYGAVLRGDINRIVVGHHTNIQDNAVLHVADALACEVGDYVTVGHGAIVHACTIQNEVLIGMGSTILDGTVVGEQSVVGANALIKQGMQIPPGSMVMGVPARIVRALTDAERAGIKSLAEKYIVAAACYLRQPVASQPRLDADSNR